MTLVLYKLLSALLIFVISFASIIYTLRKKATSPAEAIELGEALASGIFLGAAFFHLLPEALRQFDEVYTDLFYPLAEVICIFSFLFLLLLERISLAGDPAKSKHTIPYILAFTLVVHALIEGAALGVGANLTETFMLLIAIIAHKASESYALCKALLRHHLEKRRVFVIVTFFALMTPTGIALGAMVNFMAYARSGKLADAIFSAIAAGTFLYISSLHHIHFHKHGKDRQGLIEFGCLVLGAIMMGIIAVWT